MILLLDNYDSFTYNLYQAAAEVCPDIKVIRNDAMAADEALALRPQKIILSPGPGYPQHAGIMIDLIKKCPPDIAVLGICLGHQGIAAAFGAEIIEAPRPVHGKKSWITGDVTCPLFAGIDSRITVGRYHSLIIDRKSLPDLFQETATSEDGLIMAISHKSRPIFGLQFHPESILTDSGSRIIRNFICL